MARQDPPGEGGNSSAGTHTRFMVFEVSDDLTVLTFVKTEVARDRAHALALAYPDKDAAAPQRTAISENALRVEPARGARPTFPPPEPDAGTPLADVPPEEPETP